MGLLCFVVLRLHFSVNCGFLRGVGRGRGGGGARCCLVVVVGISWFLRAPCEEEPFGLIVGSTFRSIVVVNSYTSIVLFIWIYGL